MRLTPQLPRCTSIIPRHGYGSSDHTSFTAKQVPVLFFFSGLHGDYHKPSDTWDKIDAPDAVKVLQLVAEVARAICDERRTARSSCAWRSRRIRTTARPDCRVGARGLWPVISAAFRISRETREGREVCRYHARLAGGARRASKAGDILVEFGGKTDPESVRFHLCAARAQGRATR